MSTNLVKNQIDDLKNLSKRPTDPGAPQSKIAHDTPGRIGMHLVAHIHAGMNPADLGDPLTAPLASSSHQNVNS